MGEKEEDQGKQEYTDEQKDAIIKEVMECNYYPKEVTDQDIKDYLAKEENNETALENAEKMAHPEKGAFKLGLSMFIDQIADRVNRDAQELGIEPTPQTQIDINEEISLYQLKQFKNLVKEMKAEFQVEKQRLVNTFNNKEVLAAYTEEQIENSILSVWHTKKGIDDMENELRGWEQGVKRRYSH